MVNNKKINVPNLRFPEFSDEWEQLKFGMIADFKKGPFGSALKKDSFIEKSETSIKIYEQHNAIKKDWKFGRYFISNEKFKSLKGFEVIPGDIIVSCAGTIGEMYVLPDCAQFGIINQALMRVRVCKDKVLTPFFMPLFNKMIFNLSQTHSNGSAIKNIPPLIDLKNKITYIPSIDEQQKIAKLLSLIDQKIETQRKIIEEY
ncbi:MAG: restriction endonuclease subunit S, partial [Mycoplasma sp.]